MIGDEAIQFGHAEPLGGGRWRLSELWRGRRGTEWAAIAHAPGEPFALLETNTLVLLPVRAAVGGVRVMATGVGDPTGVLAIGPAVIGASVTPLPPAQMSAALSGGDLLIGWTRRSRDGWRWSDAVEVPIGEEYERYRVTKSVAGRPDLVVEITNPAWTYAAAERAADLAAGAALATISVSQIGSLGVSRAARITVSTS